MEAILAFVPEEERVHYSAMTGQSLFYMGETDLKHKVLAIAEEEGAERASYPLKLLQSEGELTIASTGKDPSTGRLVTHEYHVEGPAAILLTTTAIDLDEELQNRCLVLAVDESREQTSAIHQAQRLSQDPRGRDQRKRRRPETLTLHRNAQRLLRPLASATPTAPDLTFLDETTRTRRDHEKYLSLIDAIALLHQHQRPGEDRDGRRRAGGVHRGDPGGHRRRQPPRRRGPRPHARRAAAADPALPRPARTRWSSSAARSGARAAELPLQPLRTCARPPAGATPRSAGTSTAWWSMEYVLVHRGGRGQSFVYELLWDGEGRRRRALRHRPDRRREAPARPPDFDPLRDHFDPPRRPTLTPV